MSITERKNKNNKTVYDVAFMYKGVRYKKRGFSTKTAAREWETSVKSQVLQNGHYYVPCKKTFLEVFNEAFEIEQGKREMKPSTVKSYKAGINKINDSKISRMKIIDLDYKTIQSFFNDISSTTSESMCKHIKKCFNLVFKHAMRNEYIKTNPMPYVECHGLKYERDKETITYEEFIKLIDHFKNDEPIQIALCLGYYAGLRIGEVLALEKSDVDFDEHTITVSKNFSIASKQVLSPKTKASNATLPLSPVLEQVLVNWFDSSPYEIIVSYNGKYASYDTMAKKFRDVGFHFHMLRHTFTSNLIASGADIKTTQTLLRHGNSQTTLNIYAHSDIEKQRETINKAFGIAPKLPQNQIN